MNRFYVPAISLATLGALTVAAHDNGKTRTPPAAGVGDLLMVSAVSSTSATSLIVSNTMGIPATYDTRFGHKPAGTIEEK